MDVSRSMCPRHDTTPRWPPFRVLGEPVIIRHGHRWWLHVSTAVARQVAVTVHVTPWLFVSYAGSRKDKTPGQLWNHHSYLGSPPWRPLWRPRRTERDTPSRRHARMRAVQRLSPCRKGKGFVLTLLNDDRNDARRQMRRAKRPWPPPGRHQWRRRFTSIWPPDAQSVALHVGIQMV